MTPSCPSQSRTVNRIRVKTRLGSDESLEKNNSVFAGDRERDKIKSIVFNCQQGAYRCVAIINTSKACYQVLIPSLQLGASLLSTQSILSHLHNSCSTAILKHYIYRPSTGNTILLAHSSFLAGYSRWCEGYAQWFQWWILLHNAVNKLQRQCLL